MIITIRIEEDWGRRKKEERDEKVKKKKSKEIWQGKLNLIQKGWGFKKIGFQDLSR